MSDVTKNDKTMDDALQAHFDALHAADDETHDGRISDADLKLQLDRIEAKLDLQDQQNRTLLRHSRFRFILAAVLVVIFACLAVFMWFRVNSMYQDILSACEQVNTLSDTIQGSLDSLDSGELSSLMESLPGVLDTISSLDVDSLNDVMDKLPAALDTINSLQDKVSSLSSFFGGLGNLAGGLAG